MLKVKKARKLVGDGAGISEENSEGEGKGNKSVDAEGGADEAKLTEAEKGFFT